MNLTFDTLQPRGDTLTHDERNNGILSKYQFARHGLGAFRHRHDADDQPRHRFCASNGNTKFRAAHGLDAGCEGGFHHQISWQEFGTSMPILDLKLPPSVNQLWRTGRSKVFRSSTYDAWRKEAGWELQAQRPGLVEGAVEVSIALGCPDNRKRDLDNAAGEAVLDLLVAHQVIEDDSKVMRITSAWDRSVPASRAIIIVEPAMATAAVSVRS